MHLHIPSISVATDPKGNQFKVFDIYINGIYHCSLRYSQLLDLHNEVKGRYSMDNVIDFPPKILRISDDELVLRRKQLERYLHCLCQDSKIGDSDILINYLLSAQKASYGVADDSTVQLEVFLCNGKSKEFRSSTFAKTLQVLLSACEAIGIEKEFACYFGIFIECSKRTEDDWKMLRNCTEFECPYLSLRNASRSEEFKFRLSIRKWFFNKLYTDKLVVSKTCLNMLYVEGLAIIEGERKIELSPEDAESLTAIKKSRKELVDKLKEMVVSQELMFSGITVGENQKDCAAWVSGKYILVSKSGGNREGKIYPISKLRCWKVGVMRNTRDHFFAFEYEYQPQKFMWITLRGWSTILLTQCISKAVEEYIMMASRKEPTLMPTRCESSCKIQFTSPTFVLGLPPGVDIDMTLEPPAPHKDSDSNSDQSVDHADDDHQDLPNIDHTPDKQDEDHKTDQQSSPIVPTSSNAQTPPTSVGAGHASYVKQKKPKKSKRQNNDDTVVFNDTFLDDSDL